MPLTLRQHTITIIKEDGSELKYGTNDYIGCKYMHITVICGDIPIRCPLHLESGFDNTNDCLYHYSTYKLKIKPYNINLMLSNNGLIFEIIDQYKIYLCYNSILIHGRCIYNCCYFSGLDITIYCKNICRLGNEGEGINKLINLILVAIQLEMNINMLDTLLDLVIQVAPVTYKNAHLALLYMN